METLGGYSFDELSLGYNLVISFMKYSPWAAFTNNLLWCLCGLPSNDIPCKSLLILNYF